MEWLNSSIAPLKDLLAFLYKKSKTNDVHKKQLIIELRDNLNVFKNGFINQSPYDTMIDLLSRDAIQSAIKENFTFKNSVPVLYIIRLLMKKEIKICWLDGRKTGRQNR
jgi:hypothetical protein